MAAAITHPREIVAMRRRLHVRKKLSPRLQFTSVAKETTQCPARTSHRSASQLLSSNINRKNARPNGRVLIFPGAITAELPTRSARPHIPADQLRANRLTRAPWVIPAPAARILHIIFRRVMGGAGGLPSGLPLPRLPPTLFLSRSLLFPEADDVALSLSSQSWRTVNLRCAYSHVRESFVGLFLL